MSKKVLIKTQTKITMSLLNKKIQALTKKLQKVFFDCTLNLNTPYLRYNNEKQKN
jgi:hypothetical protein